MRLMCIMLSADVKTWWCRLIPITPPPLLPYFWNERLLLSQFTLILLHVDFRAFTYNCNVRVYLMPATCIILLFWASLLKTTGWTMIYTKPQRAVALLPLCSGKPRQHTGGNVICCQHLHSCFLWCCSSWGCTAMMNISGKQEVFRQVFSRVIEVRLSWCSNGLSNFLCISRASLLCSPYSWAWS